MEKNNCMYEKKYLYVWRKITVCMEKNSFIYGEK